jgi:hypothetical protein
MTLRAQGRRKKNVEELFIFSVTFLDVLCNVNGKPREKKERKYCDHQKYFYGC